MKKLNKMKRGFTLSEVLVALVIIGIISAITIPLLYSQYTEQERISRVKKVYAALSNALIMSKTNGGDIIFDHEINDDQETLNSWFNQYLKTYISTIKICYNQEGCWSYPVYYLNGNQDGSGSRLGMGTPCLSFILNDGTFVALDRLTLSNIGIVNSSSTYGIAMFFDINGEKKPNTFGKDIFIAAFSDDGVIPAYKGKTSSQINSNCSSSGTGYSCIMKYLRK